MSEISLSRGVGYCAMSSLLLAVGMAVLVVVEKWSYAESVFSLFLSSLLLWSVLGVIFSTLGAIIIGIPIATLLDRINLFKMYVLPIVGAVAGYYIGSMSWVSSTPNPYIQIMLAVYGAVGALAFWYGASSNKQLNADSGAAAPPPVN